MTCNQNSGLNKKNHLTRSNLTLFSKKKTHCHILDAKTFPEQIEIKVDNFLPPLTIVFNELQSKLWPNKKIIKNFQIAAMILVSMKKIQIVIFLTPKLSPNK
jgi:hypothetical protein